MGLAGIRDGIHHKGFTHSKVFFNHILLEDIDSIKKKMDRSGLQIIQCRDQNHCHNSCLGILESALIRIHVATLAETADLLQLLSTSKPPCPGHATS